MKDSRGITRLFALHCKDCRCFDICSGRCIKFNRFEREDEFGCTSWEGSPMNEEEFNSMDRCAKCYHFDKGFCKFHYMHVNSDAYCMKYGELPNETRPSN